MSLQSPIPDTGDCLHVRGSTFLNRRTLRLTKAKGESPTLSTHCGIFRDSETVQHALTKYGVHRVSWPDLKADYLMTGREWCIMSPTAPVDDITRFRWKLDLDELLPFRYSVPELALCAVDGWIERLFPVRCAFFRRLGSWWPNGIICSKHNTLAYLRMGLIPAKTCQPNVACNPEYWTPDDLWDWQFGHARQWRVRDRSANWFNDPTLTIGHLAEAT